MERYVQIGKINFKYHLLPHLLLGVLLCIVAPLMMSVENLNEKQVSRIVELFLSLLGVILLVPQFLPDQDKDIRDLLVSKREPILTVHLVRFSQALLSLLVLMALFLFRLQLGDCIFDFSKMYFGGMVSAVFLGSLGLLFYSVSDNIAIAYMMPVLYYILSYGAGKKMGNFYLFSLLRDSLTEKYTLLLVAIILVVLGIGVRCMGDYKRYLPRVKRG